MSHPVHLNLGEMESQSNENDELESSENRENNNNKRSDLKINLQNNLIHHENGKELFVDLVLGSSPPGSMIRSTFQRNIQNILPNDIRNYQTKSPYKTRLNSNGLPPSTESKFAKLPKTSSKTTLPPENIFSSMKIDDTLSSEQGKRRINPFSNRSESKKESSNIAQNILPRDLSTNQIKPKYSANTPGSPIFEPKSHSSQLSNPPQLSQSQSPPSIPPREYTKNIKKLLGTNLIFSFKKQGSQQESKSNNSQQNNEQIINLNRNASLQNIVNNQTTNSNNKEWKNIELNNDIKTNSDTLGQFNFTIQTSTENLYKQEQDTITEFKDRRISQEDDNQNVGGNTQKSVLPPVPVLRSDFKKNENILKDSSNSINQSSSLLSSNKIEEFPTPIQIPISILSETEDISFPSNIDLITNHDLSHKNTNSFMNEKKSQQNSHSNPPAVKSYSSLLAASQKLQARSISPFSRSTSKSQNQQQSQISVLNMLLDALAAKFSKVQDLKSLPNLQSKDFLQQSRFSYQNKELCKDYCPVVFQCLRYMENLKESEFSESILNRQYKILGKNLGKSGSLMFQTNDGKYFIKTIDRHEKNFLLSSLPAYYHYLHHNPSTFLLKIFALFRVRVNQLKCIHFIISKNVIPPNLKVVELYDLKGSTAGRSKKENEFVRKDLDLKRVFRLGEIRNDVMSQLIDDSRYLESLRVMDYSLLIGVVKREKISQDSKKVNEENNSFPNNEQRHSLKGTPEEKRQSVSLATVSNVLAVSETLLGSRSPNSPLTFENETKRMARGVPLSSSMKPINIINNMPQKIESTTQNQEQKNVSQLEQNNISKLEQKNTLGSDEKQNSTTHKTQSNIKQTLTPTSSSSSTPIIKNGMVARLAMQFEKNSSLKGKDLSTPTSLNPNINTNTNQQNLKNSPTINQINIGIDQAQSNSSTSTTNLSSSGTINLSVHNSTSNSHLISPTISTSTLATPITPVNLTTSIPTPITPSTPTTLSIPNRPPPVPPRLFVSQNNDSKEIKSNQISPPQFLNQDNNSKYSLSFLKHVQKEIAEEGETQSQQGKDDPKHGYNPLTQLLSSISASVERFNGQKKTNDPRFINQLVASDEFLQSVKSIQPKYAITSNISEKLSQHGRGDKGFKLVGPNHISTGSSTSASNSGTSGLSSSISLSEDEEIYFGIIDITQQFNAKKKAALVIRSVKYDPIEQSSVEPSLYATRFQKFISNIMVE